MEKFIVIALATSSNTNFEGCEIIKAEDKFDTTTKKIVFGPVSLEECQTFVTEKCGKSPETIVMGKPPTTTDTKDEKTEINGVIAADTVGAVVVKPPAAVGQNGETEKDGNHTPKGQTGVQNPDATQTHYSSSERGIVLLGIYLLLMMILSVISLAFLMRSDTDAYLEDGKTLRSCSNGKFSNANCGDCNTNISNSSNTKANTNANTIANTNASVNVNTASNVNTNTNVVANTNANTNTNANANAKTNANVKSNSTEKKNTATDSALNSNKETNTSGNTANNGNRKTEQTINQKTPEMTIPPYVCSTVFDLLSADAFVFLVVFFAGMLGAMIRAVYSFVNHLGQNDFSFKWTWYYLLLPFLGGALSLGIYFVLRGGFYGASFGKGLTLNIYSFAAFSALTGLFTANALEKLRLVAVTLLADVPPKVDNSKEVQKKNEEAKK